MKKMNFKGYECVVAKTNYMNNNNLALVLFDANVRFGPPVAYITVNTSEILPANQGFVKNYSENDGMMEAIIEAGLVSEVLGTKQFGYVTAPLVEFNLENVGDFEEVLS